MRPLLISSLTGFFLLVSGCSNIGTQPSTARTANSDLEQSVQSKINADPNLQAAGIHVSVNADRNEATLSGTVTNEDDRSRAVELTKSAGPGLTVTDKIEVKPREVSRGDYTDNMAQDAREKAKVAGDKLGKTLNDAWIYAKIEAKLASNANTPVRAINVDVEDGVVTLRGHVPAESARDEAIDVARTTDGVKRVRNMLRVTAG